MGNRDKREVVSRLSTLIEHLLKLRFSPAEDPRPGWLRTIRRWQQELRDVLKDSPSLRARLPELFEDVLARGREDAAHELAIRGEATREAVMASDLTIAQVLGEERAS